MPQDTFESIDSDLDLAQVHILRLEDEIVKAQLLEYLRQIREILENYRYELAKDIFTLGVGSNDRWQSSTFIKFLNSATLFCHHVNTGEYDHSVPPITMPNSGFRAGTYEKITRPNNKKWADYLRKTFVLLEDSVDDDLYDAILKLANKNEVLYQYDGDAIPTESIPMITTRAMSHEEEQALCEISIKVIQRLFEEGKLKKAYDLINALGGELRLYLLRSCIDLLNDKNLEASSYDINFLTKYIKTGEPKELDDAFWEDFFGVKDKNWYIRYDKCENGEYTYPDEDKKVKLKVAKEKDENKGKIIIYIRNDPKGPLGMNAEDLTDLAKFLISEAKKDNRQKLKEIVLIFGEGITIISLVDDITRLLAEARLSEVILPSSARIIDSGTFKYCRELKNVRLGENSRLIGIGDKAFEQCHALEEFDFDESLREVRLDAFDGTKVDLPERIIRQHAEVLDKKIKEIEKEAIESLRSLEKKEESVRTEPDITLIDREKFDYESRVEKLLEEYKKSIHNIMRYVSNDFIGKVHGIQQEIYGKIDKINKAYEEEAHRREEIDLINYVQDKISEVQQMLKELEEKQKREMSMDKSKLPCEYIDLTDYNFVEVLKQQIDSKSEKLSEETLSILKVKMEVLNALQEQINSTINSLNDMYSKEEERRKEEAFWNEHSYELDKNGEKVAIVYVHGIRKPDGTVPPEKYHYEVERYKREYEELYEKIERILSSRHVKKVKVVFGTNVIENYSELFLEYIDKVVSVSIEPAHTPHTYRVFDFY